MPDHSHLLSIRQLCFAAQVTVFRKVLIVFPELLVPWEFPVDDVLRLSHLFPHRQFSYLVGDRTVSSETEAINWEECGAQRWWEVRRSLGYIRQYTRVHVQPLGLGADVDVSSLHSSVIHWCGFTIQTFQIKLSTLG